MTGTPRDEDIVADFFRKAIATAKTATADLKRKYPALLKQKKSGLKTETLRDRTMYGPGCDRSGQINYALPPRGVAFGEPPEGLRNHDCSVDGCRDPDNSGLCIHCGRRLGEDEDEDA